MATFREAREALLFAYQDGSIDDTEFALLYDLNSSENLEFPYWKYGRFDLNPFTRALQRRSFDTSRATVQQGHETGQSFGRMAIWGHS